MAEIAVPPRDFERFLTLVENATAKWAVHMTMGEHAQRREEMRKLFACYASDPRADDMTCAQSIRDMAEKAKGGNELILYWAANRIETLSAIAAHVAPFDPRL